MSTRAAAELATIDAPDVGAPGTLWVHLQLTEPSSGTPRAATASGRDHFEAQVGRRLTVAGVSWRIVSVERPGAGRMTLRLEL